MRGIRYFLVAIALAVIQWVPLSCLAEKETRLQTDSRKTSQIEESYGKQSYWPYYRGPNVFEGAIRGGTGYASIGASPWKEAWKKITQYCEDPNLIGPYDIEVLGRLWIADLYQQQMLPKRWAAEGAVTLLKPQEVPTYLNIFDVLNSPNSDTSEDTSHKIRKVDNSESPISSEMITKAIAFVRCYSHYYSPIKTFGAFRKRDLLRRDALAQLVGDDAVKAMEDDYMYGGSRLYDLTASYIEKLRKQRLSTIKFDSDDETILNFAKDFCKSNFDCKPADEDVVLLKTLWKEAVSKDKTLKQTLQTLRSSVPLEKGVDEFAFAIVLEQDFKLWQRNLPPTRPAGYPPTIGDFPYGHGARGTGNSLGNSYSSAFQWYQTQIMNSSATRLVRPYFGYKQLLKKSSNPKATDSVTHQSKDGSHADGYANIMRRSLVSIVGEEAVQQLERSWKVKPKSQY